MQAALPVDQTNSAAAVRGALGVLLVQGSHQPVPGDLQAGYSQTGRWQTDKQECVGRPSGRDACFGDVYINCMGGGGQGGDDGEWCQGADGERCCCCCCCGAYVAASLLSAPWQ